MLTKLVFCLEIQKIGKVLSKVFAQRKNCDTLKLKQDGQKFHSINMLSSFDKLTLLIRLFKEFNFQPSDKVTHVIIFFHARVKELLEQIAKECNWEALSIETDFETRITGVTRLITQYFSIYIWATRKNTVIRLCSTIEAKKILSIRDNKFLYDKNFDSFSSDPYSFLQAITKFLEKITKEEARNEKSGSFYDKLSKWREWGE